MVTYDVTDSFGNSYSSCENCDGHSGCVPVITLSGESVTVAATSYADAGARNDNIDGDISAVNSVDINVPGTYLVTYNVTDSAGNAAAEAVRKVNVVDTTAPVITLSGGTEGSTAESPYSTNDPAGNGSDGQLNTDDDVVIKDLYVVEGLTFDTAAGTWGTAAGRDLDALGQTDTLENSLGKRRAIVVSVLMAD